jgi:hypothetical protein
MVRSSVPASQWCGGEHSNAEVATTPRRGWMFWKKNG